MHRLEENSFPKSHRNEVSPVNLQSSSQRSDKVTGSSSSSYQASQSFIRNDIAAVNDIANAAIKIENNDDIVNAAIKIENNNAIVNAAIKTENNNAIVNAAIKIENNNAIANAAIKIKNNTFRVHSLNCSSTG